VALVGIDISEEYIASIIFSRDAFRLQVTANVVPNKPNLVNLMMEAICSSEKSVLATGTRLNVLEDGTILIVLQIKK
jgi:hypothetical protein